MHSGEWDEPLTEEKIEWLTAQFAELRRRFAAMGYSPAMEQRRRRRRQREFWEVGHR